MTGMLSDHASEQKDWGAAVSSVRLKNKKRSHHIRDQAHSLSSEVLDLYEMEDLYSLVRVTERDCRAGLFGVGVLGVCEERYLKEGAASSQSSQYLISCCNIKQHSTDFLMKASNKRWCLEQQAICIAVKFTIISAPVSGWCIVNHARDSQMVSDFDGSKVESCRWA